MIQHFRESSADANANILAGPSPRRKSGRDMHSLLATICELQPTEISPVVQPLLLEENLEGQHTSNRQPMFMRHILVQGASFWRASMSANTEYFLSGGVRGRRARLEASLVAAVSTAGTNEPVHSEVPQSSASGAACLISAAPGALPRAVREWEVKKCAAN
jgi:hypothetical protein